MSPSKHDLLPLIDAAYRAVGHPERWEPFLERLSYTVGLKWASLSSLSTPRNKVRMGVWHGIDDTLIEEYNTRIVSVSPFIEPSLELANPRVCGPAEMAVPREEFEGTEFHDWMLRAGTGDSLCAVDYRPDSGVVSLAGYMETEKRVTDDQVDLVRELMPHLFHAMALSRQALEAAIQSAIGVRDTDDKPTEPEYIFKLQRIGERRPVEMLVSPLRPLGHPLFGELHGALLIFSDPEHLDEGIAERLQQVHDLTPTEAEVAQWLMAGASTNEIADIFDNSIHTIRTHLKRVMTKCNASTQVELVGRLQRSLVRLA